MKIREIMTRQVVSAEPDTTLEEIATIMRDENVGAVPIMEGRELLGIITDRDIVVRCIAEGKHASECRAEDILSEELEIVDPNIEVEKAAEMMSGSQVRRLPVVENGELVGMVSLGDIAVKRNDDRLSGDALEGISRGVKRASGSVKTKSSANSRANDSKKQESSRQSRVVPIRPEAKGKGRTKAS